MKKDSSAHEWDGGRITKRPTVSKEGEKTFECTVCGKTRTETLPTTGGYVRPPKRGSISEEVQPGENAPKTVIKSPYDELADIVLTSAERAEVNDGTDIAIILKIEDGALLVSASDKAIVEAVIGGMSDYKLGQYLEVNLLKTIGGVQEKITETKAPITIMFEIPEALRGEGREYAVIRVHDGETAVLPDLDEDENTVTIRTDRFSTYPLAYIEKTDSDASVKSGESGETTSESSEPATESSEPATESSEPTSESGDSTDSGDTSSESGEGSSDSDPAPVSGEASRTDESGTSPSTDETDPVPSEDASSGDTGDTENPVTGIAVSITPLIAALSAMIVFKRKKR